MITVAVAVAVSASKKHEVDQEDVAEVMKFILDFLNFIGDQVQHYCKEDSSGWPCKSYRVVGAAAALGAVFAVFAVVIASANIFNCKKTDKKVV